MDFVDNEIKCIKNCNECYANGISQPESWFTLACSKPHLVVWIKTFYSDTEKPAKLMAVNGQSVSVNFFGDHSLADVPATDCFLYSESDMNTLSPSKEIVVSFFVIFRLSVKLTE